MGLDTTHGCWHGAYSAFSRWRTALCVAAEWPMGKAGDPPIYDVPTNIDWDQITEENLMGHWDHLPEDPLVVLQAHSDCDGEIPTEFCGPLADRLEQLIPKLPENTGGGHIWDLRGVTQQFVDGLRLAAAAHEPVGFH